MKLQMPKTLFPVFLFLLLGSELAAQRIKNPFFPLHNIIRDDSTYRTPDQQVALIKKIGYDGLEINQVERFEAMKAALDRHRLPAAFFYVKVDLDQAALDARLPGYLAQLRGSQTIVAPYVVGNPKQYPPSSQAGDTLTVRLLGQLADLSQTAGLQVAIYPHIYFYVERTDHAQRLVRAANRPNLGLAFNLCHWLATTPAPAREGLRAHLGELRPHLKLVTICGANNVETTDKNIWNDYILPLGQGSFDTFGLVNYLVNDLGYQAPIGVQCYNLRGDKPELARRTFAVWQQYKKQLKKSRNLSSGHLGNG
jgi:sugar phosphate isomerase/epimerase